MGFIYDVRYAAAAENIAVYVIVILREVIDSISTFYINAIFCERVKQIDKKWHYLHMAKQI